MNVPNIMKDLQLLALLPPPRMLHFCQFVTLSVSWLATLLKLFSGNVGLG